MNRTPVLVSVCVTERLTGTDLNFRAPFPANHPLGARVEHNKDQTPRRSWLSSCFPRGLKRNAIENGQLIFRLDGVIFSAYMVQVRIALIILLHHYR